MLGTLESENSVRDDMEVELCLVFFFPLQWGDNVVGDKIAKWVSVTEGFWSQ